MAHLKEAESKNRRPGRERWLPGNRGRRPLWAGFRTLGRSPHAGSVRLKPKGNLKSSGKWLDVG
jgi:hypothetical protein